MMTPERWEQIGQLYHEALQVEPAARAPFLDRLCAGDDELRREVESLLAADAEADGFIAATAFEDASELLAAQDGHVLAGKRLGDYKVIELLGRGGMGEVYLAHDARLERRVALKLLIAAFTRDESRVHRFVREARAVSALNHPNIVTIYELGEFGEAGSRHYIATEFIEGKTLRQLLNQDKLPPAAALDIAVQIASALGAAHDAGIIHRDIKPENVMLRPDGLVKVLDFGLAKLTDGAAAALNSSLATKAETKAGASGFKTEPGAIMGTVTYMSPEQLSGGKEPASVDARSDLFSLGVIWYEMLAGRRPFAGETTSHLVVAIMDREPPPISQFAPEVPAEFERIAGKALEKDRERRYQSARELLADLKKLRRQLELQGDPMISLDGNLVTADPAMPTAEVRPVSTHSGEVLQTGGTLARIRRLTTQPRNLAAIALIILLLALVAAMPRARHSTALSEKDTVLLADFVNQTGDEVFDHTLRHALAVQLEQTPFLNFFPDERVRETLRYMGRKPNERVTKDLAREIGQRQGIKAVLAGEIVRFDRRYSITLEAASSQTGETIASAMAEAEGKDQVLRALTTAATRLRQRLGESLASIQKFAAPPEQATTSSLEAFKAWSRGVELSRIGKMAEAIPFYKHAKELDPDFARADVSLSLVYGGGGQLELAAEHAARAFALRDRVTEREKLDIAGIYHTISTGDLVRAIEIFRLRTQTYPRDNGDPARLAYVYRLVGYAENSLAAAREAYQINPRAAAPNIRMWTALVLLNRFDEAQAVIERAIGQQIAVSTARGDLYQIALIKGDSGLMKRQIDSMTGTPDEYLSLLWQAQSASFAGQLRQAQDFYRRASALSLRGHPERAARFAEEALLTGAACGLCREVKTGKEAPLTSSRISAQLYVPVAASRALALALCGEAGRAQSLADKVQKSNPQSTLANAIWLPVIRAAIELQRGNPDLVVELLQATAPYEQAALFWPNYLRGQAYLRRKSGAEAAAEFQKILDHRGWDPASPLYPLAQLGLARAAALAPTREDGAARYQAYQRFLRLWETADSDLPILNEARRELAELRLKR